MPLNQRKQALKLLIHFMLWYHFYPEMCMVLEAMLFTFLIKTCVIPTCTLYIKPASSWQHHHFYWKGNC